MSGECDKCGEQILDCGCVKWKTLEKFRPISIACIEHDQKFWENIQKLKYFDKLDKKLEGNTPVA